MHLGISMLLKFLKELRNVTLCPRALLNFKTFKLDVLKL